MEVNQHREIQLLTEKPTKALSSKRIKSENWFHLYDCTFSPVPWQG